MKQAVNVNLAGMSFSKTIVRFAALVVGIALTSTGCKTYEQQNKVIVKWRQGNIPAAVAEATKEADHNASNKDAIVWRLEQAATLRAAGRYEESNKAFDQAQEKIDGYAEKAKVRLGQEAGALLSNQANLDYEGRSYDGIMLNTYKALNYLALGDPERARPELIRAYQRQSDAVQANRRRIEKTREEAEQNKDSKYINRAANDPKFQSDLQKSMSDINSVKIYTDYVNPFTVYLDGLYFMANATGASDLERAHKSLERVAGMVEGNKYVDQDLAEANDLANGKPLAPTTYVIFETGCAPIREQLRIDIPIIISKVSYVGAAFPTIKTQGDFQRMLTVTANGTNYETQIVGSMDSVIVRDFKNDQPIVILKTIAATVTKAVAAYVANDYARRQNDWVGLAVQIATAGYQMAVNIADTRTWTTLPKEFQVCRFPTPPNGKIELSTPNGMKVPVLLGAGNADKIDLTSTNAQATLITGGLINVVYVKSITAGSPLLVSQFKLK
jgi:hypothetical protein